MAEITVIPDGVPYPPCITVELQHLGDMKAEVLTLEDVATLAHAVQSAFSHLSLDVRIIRWTAEPPFVAIQQRDVKTFRDAIPLLSDLASRGWHTDKQNAYTDYVEVNRRTYNLQTEAEAKANADKENHWRKYRLRLMVFLAREGATCRKVQKGTEPVYEFVCEDSPS